MRTAGLSDIKGLSVASNPESPIVFLKLEKSTGSVKEDFRLLDDIADHVSTWFFLHRIIFERLSLGINYLFSWKLFK